MWVGIPHPVEEVEKETQTPEMEANRHYELTVAGLASIHLIHKRQHQKAGSLAATTQWSATEESLKM